ncbi:ParB/RepB/Spo0J family partition protein [Micromonospora sp. NPDC005172]|uniref:ParB/RepB/Spo0J family partition protein n=1 Tax=Micromonospora sp. NPDC005172 TaxID=3156867 RepID=UPI0033A8DEC8
MTTTLLSRPVSDDLSIAEVTAPADLAGPTLRAQYLDPRDLVDNPRNLRTDVGDLSDLTASMAVVGVLCPLVVIPVPDQPNAFQLIIGHRRKYAAIELGMEQVPVWVASDEGAAAQIVAQLAENGHRVGLTPTEEAEAFHQLTLLDWSPEQIATVRAIPTAKVKQTLKLRELPQAARGAADAGTLTLEDAAALTEFTEDPAALDRILKGTGSSWGFRHAIAAERSKRTFAAAKERAKAELVLAGVKVTSKPKGYPCSGTAVAAMQLADANGIPLDPDVYPTLAGLAAFVEKIGDHAQTTFYCAEPDRYGYQRLSYGSRRGVTEEERARREAAEQARAEYLAGLTVAADVRREFYRTAYGSARAVKRLFLEALRATVVDGLRFRDVDGLYATLGGVDGAAAVVAREDKLRRCLVAQWICVQERNLGYAARDETWALDDEAAVAWLDQLVADGYTLSEAETTLRDSLGRDPQDELPNDEDTDESTAADAEDPDFGDIDAETEQADGVAADDDVLAAPHTAQEPEPEATESEATGPEADDLSDADELADVEKQTFDDGPVSGKS